MIKRDRSHALDVPCLDLAAIVAARVAAIVDAARKLPPDRVLVRRAPAWYYTPGLEPSDEEQAQYRAESTGDMRAFGASAHASQDGWPAGLPLPLTVADALAEVERCAAELVETTVAEVERCAELADPLLRAAVLARRAVVDGWPLTASDPAKKALSELLAAIGRPVWEGQPGDPGPVWARPPGRPVWPAAAAPLDVAEWAAPGLNRVQRGLGDELTRDAREMGQLSSWAWDGKRYPAAGLALLFLAEREVREGLRRPAVAIDAGKAHHDLLTGWRGVPRDGVRHRAAPGPLAELGGRVELMLPGHPVQLTLPMAELVGVSEGAVRLLRELRGAKGIRHWCALQRLFSVEGGRAGWVRWTLDEHLAAMGYRKTGRADPKVRAEAVAEVETLTRMELVIYGTSNDVRYRAPLLVVGSRFERLAGAAWNLEGMELRINDLLYSGVRDSKTGELGTNWWPVPVELAQIDHARHPYAHALGLLLAVRFRWDAGDGRACTRLTGRKLLDLAGIPYKDRRAAEAWSKLQRELAELVARGMLAEVRWVGDAWSLDGTCCLSPAAWVEDRTARQLTSTERPVVDLPLTGAELRTWRTAKVWSRRELARRLDLAPGTIDAAEAKPETELGPKVTAALAGWRDAAGA